MIKDKVFNTTREVQIYLYQKGNANEVLVDNAGSKIRYNPGLDRIEYQKIGEQSGWHLYEQFKPPFYIALKPSISFDQAYEASCVKIVTPKNTYTAINSGEWTLSEEMLLRQISDRAKATPTQFHMSEGVALKESKPLKLVTQRRKFDRWPEDLIARCKELLLEKVPSKEVATRLSLPLPTVQYYNTRINKIMKTKKSKRK